MTGEAMTGEARRVALPQRTVASRLVVVARAARAEDYDGVLDVLVEAGIRSVELTLTTPGTFDRGFLHPGEQPGLGVELDEDAAAAFDYTKAYLPVNRLTDGTVHDW